MHEQQESVSGEVSHRLCRSPSDNMTSLKFITVLEIQGHITKNDLLRTCSVYLFFWSKNASCSCKWTCSTKRAGDRPRWIYQYSSMCPRISGQNFQVSCVPQIPKDTQLQRNYFKRKINAITWRFGVILSPLSNAD